MAKKYSYSRTLTSKKGVETFSAVEFDSFDEAIKAVDRGIDDRRRVLEAEGCLGADVEPQPRRIEAPPQPGPAGGNTGANSGNNENNGGSNVQNSGGGNQG